ncbi:MAG: Ppx/GppA phosphatase family protein [Candidatus Promineifilaceae bacterium]
MSSESQKVAIIDLGSNTARMIVMQALPGYAYRLEDEIREVVRLRQGLTDAGLSDQSIARALFTLRLFKRYCDSSGVDVIIATATSAVRDATNGPQFVERVAQELGLHLRVLDGEREGYYATIGVLNDQPLAHGLVVDIGGGSAQIAQVRNHRYVRSQSLTLGALALTERFITTDPVSTAEVTAVQQEIARQLDTIPWLTEAATLPNVRLVGVGGTIRNLASIEAKRQAYPLNTLHGFVLTRESVAQTIAQLRELPLAERQTIPGLNSDRADIILPGAMVIEAVMSRLGMEQLTISVNGLREGLFLEHFWQHLPYPVMADVRRFAVLNMARVYRYQKRHANHVRYLAGRMFNQLSPLHGYGLAERELLDAAALLHDLGTIISYNDHHRHSQTLIINSGLPGYTSRETALIALLARYHRKGKPSVSGYERLLWENDEKRLWQLAAILRLAEFLERGRNAAVDDVAVVWNDEELRLTLIADAYPAVELWEAERHAVALMEVAYGRKVVLDSTAVPDT